MSYLVSERGPEIFTPSATGQVSTNAALDRLTTIGSATIPAAEIGRQVVEGSGGEPVAPSTKAVAKARPEAGAKQGKRERSSFHAGSRTSNIMGGGDPREIRGQVESIFSDLLRQHENDQRGSLSD